MSTTPEQRDGWSALAEAATRGPWVALGNSIGAEVKGCTCKGPDDTYGHEQYCGIEGPVITGADVADAAFIAAARTAVPALLAENAELRADLEDTCRVSCEWVSRTKELETENVSLRAVLEAAELRWRDKDQARIAEREARIDAVTERDALRDGISALAERYDGYGHGQYGTHSDECPPCSVCALLANLLVLLNPTERTET